MVITTYKEEKINKFIFIEYKLNLPTKNIVVENLIAKLFETFPVAIGLFFFLMDVPDQISYLRYH